MKLNREEADFPLNNPCILRMKIKKGNPPGGRRVAHQRGAAGQVDGGIGGMRGGGHAPRFDPGPRGDGPRSRNSAMSLANTEAPRGSWRFDSDWVQVSLPLIVVASSMPTMSDLHYFS